MKDLYKQLSVLSLVNHISLNKKKFINVLIFGNFGAYNMGDEAILAGQIEDLRKKKNIIITVASRFPDRTKKIHRVLSISQKNIIKIIKTILQSDAVIVGGGGLFCKNDRGIIGLVFQIYTLLLYILLPLVLRKKVFIWGVGFYKDTNILISLFLKFLSRYVTIFSVRDFESYENSKKKRMSVSLHKDNSFLMDLTPISEIKKNINFSSVDKLKNNIGIAVKEPENKNEGKKIIHEIAKFIELNYDNSDFWFYSMDTHPRYSSDKDFGKKILLELPKSIRKFVSFHFVPINLHPQIFFSSFQLMDFFITVRLHAAIFSYRTEKAFYGISYGRKTSTFLESIGKKPIRYDSVSSDEIQKEFLKTKNNTDEKYIYRKENLYAY